MSAHIILLINIYRVNYFLNRFIMDGAFRRLGRNTDFEPILGAPGVRVLHGVTGLQGALEALGIIEILVEFFLVRTLRRLGLADVFAKFEALRDVVKEYEDFLEVPDLRFPPACEKLSRSWGAGPGLEARRGNLGLPDVGSDILMKLPTLISFSCVFLGAGGVLAGVDTVPERFTGLGVTMSFRPTRGDLGAGERCLLSEPVRWADRRLELLALAPSLGLVVWLERGFGPASTDCLFNFDGRFMLPSGTCTNNT
jgi:hypothetical protein